MFKRSNVCILYCLFSFILISGSASEPINNEFLAHLGIQKVFYAEGFLFNSFYKLVLELDFEMDMPNEINLDCNRYTNTNSDNPNILSNLPRKRTTRSASQTDFSIFNPKCRFSFDDLAYDQSETEEKEFNNFLQSPATILCEDNFSDSCILKAYHFPKLDVFYRRRLLLKKRFA